ncbi:MAG: iron ABC transporter permease [Rhodospirillales bacterium]|nr:iron ABC transporter permease [Rhodospirillales bacterium]
MATRTVNLPKMRFDRRKLNPWHIAIFLVVTVLVAVPVAILILGSFSNAKMPTDFTWATLTFDNYPEVWLDPGTYNILYNTVVYVVGATFVGVSVAAILAWLVERTTIPGKIWIYAGVPLALAVPGLLQAMAWVILASPRSGFINRFVMDKLGFESALIDIYTLGGMIFVEGLRLVPTAFLMMVPLLRSMDPALEEAAYTSGARPLSTARKITLMLMAPGFVAVTIYQAIIALEVFEVPGVLGMPADIHVFSTRVYMLVAEAEFLPTYGQANALAMLYLGVALVASYFYWRLIRRSERFTVVTGKGYRPKLTPLGKWRYPAIGFVVLFMVLAIILPFLVLLYTSLVKTLQPPSWEVFSTMSFRWYEWVFDYVRFGSTLTNTFEMVFATATIVTVLSFAISLIVVRSKFVARRVLDQMAFMPHAIPGVVMGLAFLWAFLQYDKFTGTELFGSIWSVVLVFVVSFIAYGTRTMNAAILQIHSDLEEAASVSGAPPWRTLWRVFMPLMMPSLVGIWVYVVLLSVRLAGAPLILYEGRRTEVLAVLIWYLWDDGEWEAVAAMGVMLMIGLFTLVLLLRGLGFGRSMAQAR